MKKQVNYIGGFVSTNTGTIRDSYSLMQIGNQNCVAGGFAGQNSGKIERSFYDNQLKGLTGGFIGSGIAASDTCYFFHNEKSDKQLKQLFDKEFGKKKSEISNTEQAEALTYDLEKIWEYHNGTPIFKFQGRNWMYDTSSIFENADPDEIFSIETAEELIDFSRKVNLGSIIYREAKVRILSDIDLSGKEWIPIGSTISSSFNGVFDGCGHSISNFVIKNPKQENKGFFGFLSGKVYNVTIDCMIQGDGYIGGLAAQNLSGTIGCCAAIVDIKQKKNKHTNKSMIGGLVGYNTGTIFESYTAGKYAMVAIIFFWPIIGIGAGTAALITATIIFNLPTLIPDYTPIFNKIPEDIKQTIIEEEQEKTPRTDSNFVSFQFNKEIQVDLDTGLCTLDYKNPGDSNHNTIVQLQITDNVALKAMGGTGRDAVEQAQYEAREDYDPEAYRVILASSDSISPGYQVAALSLSDYARANMAPGSYDAVIMIYPYDMNTNNKAMLESQLPVVMVVK